MELYVRGQMHAMHVVHGSCAQRCTIIFFFSVISMQEVVHGKTGFNWFWASGPKRYSSSREAKFREGIILGKLHRYDEAPAPMAPAPPAKMQIHQRLQAVWALQEGQRMDRTNHTGHVAVRSLNSGVYIARDCSRLQL